VSWVPERLTRTSPACLNKYEQDEARLFGRKLGRRPSRRQILVSAETEACGPSGSVQRARLVGQTPSPGACCRVWHARCALSPQHVLYAEGGFTNATTSCKLQRRRFFHRVRGNSNQRYRATNIPHQVHICTIPIHIRNHDVYHVKRTACLVRSIDTSQLSW
jgi:hypothetical protein